jgi:hypothetical protein
MLILFGIAGLLATYIDLSIWAWVAILAAGGLAVLIIYLTDRSMQELLIPIYVLWVIAAFLALIELNILRDQIIATYVLAAIGLPFLVVYLRNRAEWWYLIPAYVMLAIAGLVALTGARVVQDRLVPAYVMFAIAIPFMVVYVRNRANWWALIPGGIMAIIGTAFLLTRAIARVIVPVIVILGGLGIMIRQFTRKEPVAAETPEPTEPKQE